MRLSLSKVVVLLLLIPFAAAAQIPPKAPDLPPVNLGFTSFLDGGPPAGPGFYFQQYVQYYSANNFHNADGKEATRCSDTFALQLGTLLDDLDLVISLSQFIYQSNQAILPGGGRWGVDFIVPLIGIDVDPGPARLPNGKPLTDNNEGLGDIVIGPYIQWDPIMGKNGPLFMHRIEFQNIIPTGKYDDDRLLNPGSNFYSFNPYWAATFFATPQWTITWRLHYLWNAKNDDPAQDLWAPANDTQAGQAIHVNFASAIEVIPQQFRVGLNGYYLEQITDSKVNGRSVLTDWFGPGNPLILKDLREKTLALGPGMVYHFSQDDHLFFNAYFEMETEARTEGMRFNLRWTHHF